MAYADSNKLSNKNNEIINPATEETLMLLRRLLQLANTLNTQDSNQRLRVNVDAMGSVTLPTVTTVGTVSSITNYGGSAVLPTVTTVGTVNTVGISTATYLGGGTGGGVDSRYLMVDTARNAYANSIRSKLSFS